MGLLFDPRNNKMFIVLMVLSELTFSQSQSVFQSNEEVVSIYDDNFGTPRAREPYFIKVFRCVDRVCEYNSSLPPYLRRYPVPTKKTQIEIVVPDLNEDKFYKYIVYNHTSCKCDHKSPDKKSLHLYDDSGLEVNREDFDAKYPKNPINVRRLQSSCNEPQQRYLFTYKGYFPSFVESKSCLPGCNATKRQNSNYLYVRSRSSRKKKFPLLEHSACRNYIAPADSCPTPKPSGGPISQSMSPDGTLSKLVSLSGSPSQLVSPIGPSSHLSPPREIMLPSEGNPLSIYIGSAEIFLAALLLSILLVTILIVDFAMCSRKRGLLYGLFNCKKRDLNHCSNCNGETDV